MAERKLAGRVKVSALGPAPALLAKLKGRFRWQILLKGADVKELNRFAWEIKRGFERMGLKGVNVTIDMDPVTTV
jgi:primosomal protein N' (replication factor Y)